MYYLHHRVDEDTNYVVDTSDWSMNKLDDANVAQCGVIPNCPSISELDYEDNTLESFWDHFAGTDESDVNAYLMAHELYSLTDYLSSKMGTSLRFDAMIDIWKSESYIFCRGYTETGLCICWYSDGEYIEFFSFSGLDINQPYLESIEDLQASLGRALWDGEGYAGVFYTPAMTKLAIVRFSDGASLIKPELLLFDWGKDTYLYEDESDRRYDRSTREEYNDEDDGYSSEDDGYGMFEGYDE